MRSIVWFRHDLRVDDHAPLVEAAAQGPVVPVYCFDPRDWGETRAGFPKTGAARTRFLLESVADLRLHMDALGAPLIVRSGRPEDVIPEMARAHQVERVHFHREPMSEEKRVERRLGRALRELDVELVGHWGHTLYDPEDLPFALHDLPSVFSKFRRIVEKKCEPVQPVEAPTRLECVPHISPGSLPAPDELGGEPFEDDPRAPLRFHGGITAAHARLEEYFWKRDRLRVYKETRNGMLEADDSSKLSPWLACGAISARRVAAEVDRYETERVANDSTYWLIFELLWRDFFRFVGVQYGSSLFQAAGIQGIELPWRSDLARFEPWRTGRTGVPLVDANMRELLATGFLSNRGRQIVASFLTKNLGVDWRLGAEWFESQLVDYDVTSNYGNWNYAAGVGNDARGFRYFHIPKQARSYDPDGDYVRHWIPELSKIRGGRIHAPWKSTEVELAGFGITLGEDYPEPVVDLDASVAVERDRFEAALTRTDGFFH